MCCAWQRQGISYVLFNCCTMVISANKTHSVFFPPPMHKNIKQRRLPVANQASVAGGLKRLNSNARNPAAAAATPLWGKINNAKLHFQSHECEAGFSKRWSTQTGEDCLFSAALVTSSGEHSNSDANMQREPALQLPSKGKKIERGGGDFFLHSRWTSEFGPCILANAAVSSVINC